MRKGLRGEPSSVTVWIESLGTGACLQGSSRLDVQMGFSSEIFLVASHCVSASAANNRLCCLQHQERGQH